MEKITGIFLFLFFTINTSGQQSKIDSLKKSLNQINSKQEKLTVLNNLSLTYMNNGNLKNGIPYFNQLSRLAKELNNIDLETKGYNFISEAYMKDMDSVKSISYARKSINISNNKNDLKNYLIGINQLGRVYYHFRNFQNSINTYEKGIQKFYENEDEKLLYIIARIHSNSTWSYDGIGKTEESIEAVFKGIKIAEKIKSMDQKSYGFYVLGSKYKDLSNFEKSEKYYLKSLKLADSVSQFTYVNMNHHGLGILYSRWGKFEKAMYHNKKALAFYRKQGDKIYEFDVLHNIAVVYQKKSNSDSVFKYGNLALKVAEKLNHKFAINGTKTTLAEEYLKNNNFEKSKKYSLDVISDTLIPRVVDINSKALLFLNLSIIYENQKEYLKSLHFFKKYKKTNDSIFKQRLDSKYTELETKYQFEKKEKENLQLKAENSEQILANQKANNRNWILGLSLLILLIIAFSIWRRYKAETKAKQIISEQKTKIEKLHKEFHHRLKNDFRSINSFISLVQKHFSDVEFKERLNELKNRVTSMFKVHEILLQEGDITQVKAHPYLLELSQNVEEKHNNKNIKLICNVDETETIIADKAIPFGIVLNEFVTNSYKYAFDENGGEISIDFKSDNQNHNLTLKDNGKGLPVDFNIENLSSLGMSIIPMFADLYNGSYKIDGTNGVSLLLTLPKKVI